MAPAMFSSCTDETTPSPRATKIVAVDIVPDMSSLKQMTASDAVSTQSTVPNTVVTEDDLTDSPLSEEKEGDHLSETSDDDSETKEDGEDDYFGDVSAVPLSDPPQHKRSRSGSILKVTSSEMFIKEKRGSWMQLPKPDLGHIRSVSMPVTEKEKEEARQSKRVSFHVIEVRSYQQTLGDNPSVSYGPPISLDWEWEDAGTHDLEEFETKRGPRRTLRQMMLNYYHRKALLTHKVGATEDEQNKAEQGVNRIKRERSITRAMLPCRKLEEVVQSAARKSKRALFGKKRSPKAQTEETSN